MKTKVNLLASTLWFATLGTSLADTGLRLESASYYAAEESGLLMVGVVRGDDSDFPVSVDYRTSDVSAEGRHWDYTGEHEHFSSRWGKGETFTIPILNDAVKESPESFRVSLEQSDEPGPAPGVVTV
jgi:hypothetical protein